ncbi:MAG: hypothetical protein ABSF15_13650 [Candidatus Sulfotelmatobacter sp.]
MTQTTDSERVTRVQKILNVLVDPLDTTYPVGWHRSPESYTRATLANYVEEIADTVPLVDDLTKRTDFTAETIIMLWRKAEDELLALAEDMEPDERPDVPYTRQEFAYGGVLYAHNHPAPWKPTVIPMLGVNEYRLVCANRQAFLDQFKLYATQWEHVLDKYNIVYRMAPSGEYVIDIVPKNGELREILVY